MNNIELLKKWMESKEANQIDLDSDRFEKVLWGKLIGQTVTSILISEKLLCIDVIGARLVWELDAACCSETWFADAVGAPNLINQRVTSVESIPNDVDEKYDTEDNRGKQNYDIVYGYKIRSGKGCFVFSFRNSSNGYYGGNIETSDILLLPDNMNDISEMDVWQS